MTVVKLRKRFAKDVFLISAYKNSKMAKNVFFEAKNHKNVDKKVLSWPKVMVNSLKNQKKLV